MTDQADDQLPGDDLTGDDDGTATVLELFGVKLNVRNKRIAEVLTMDASEALQTDVRQLVDPSELRDIARTASEAAPDVMLATPTGREAADSRLRADMRSRADAIASTLGFDVGSGGVWESPTGIEIVTRIVERPVTFAAASDFVEKIDAVLKESGKTDATALFVVESQQTADVFKVAIRQRRLYDHVRTISTENLDTIRALYVAEAIDHSRALVLLTPIANADVGEILNIVRAAGAGDRQESSDL